LVAGKVFDDGCACCRVVIGACSTRFWGLYWQIALAFAALVTAVVT